MQKAFKIKPISPEAIPAATDKARQYRLLNEAEQAESICRDILRVRPDDQQALSIIVLALSDQFSNNHAAPALRTAREYVDKLTDEYQRVYYTGLLYERQGRALMTRGMAGGFAYDSFRAAMDWYEKAQAIRPQENDESILRWNNCVRMIRRANLTPREDEAELPLE